MTDRLITGFVDGVVDGRLNGWIVNLASPSLLEPIKIGSDTGFSQTFLPLVYRSDVCDHLGLNGRFGFAIPIRSLGVGVRTITVTSLDGVPLEGGIDISIGDSRQGSMSLELAPTRIYLHIQKTSGTSLRADLETRYSQYEILYAYPSLDQGIPDHLIASIPRHQLTTFDLVFGHLRFGLHRSMQRDAVYITTVRDPIDRLRSQVWHLLRLEDSGLLDRPVSELANQNVSDELDNLMVRVLSGYSVEEVPCGSVDRDLVRQSLSNLRNHFLFVGVTESSSADYNSLLRSLGVPPRSRSHLNRAETRDLRRLMKSLDIDWPTLLHRNRFDIDLFKAMVDDDLLNRSLREFEKP